MERRVCQHFQTGYCKFGINCRKHDVFEMCHEELGDKRKCKKRHLKYFSKIPSCKFGETYCYRHIISKSDNDSINLGI